MWNIHSWVYEYGEGHPLTEIRWRELAAERDEGTLDLVAYIESERQRVLAANPHLRGR